LVLAAAVIDQLNGTSLRIGILRYCHRTIVVDCVNRKTGILGCLDIPSVTMNPDLELDRVAVIDIGVLEGHANAKPAMIVIVAAPPIRTNRPSLLVATSLIE
jgi:hypothetical protein